LGQILGDFWTSSSGHPGDGFHQCAGTAGKDPGIGGRAPGSDALVACDARARVVGRKKNCAKNFSPEKNSVKLLEVRCVVHTDLSEVTLVEWSIDRGVIKKCLCVVRLHVRTYVIVKKVREKRTKRSKEIEKKDLMSNATSRTFGLDKSLIASLPPTRKELVVSFGD
jgi:hypothetical protein